MNQPPQNTKFMSHFNKTKMQHAKRTTQPLNCNLSGCWMNRISILLRQQMNTANCFSSAIESDRKGKKRANQIAHFRQKSFEGEWKNAN